MTVIGRSYSLVLGSFVLTVLAGFAFTGFAFTESAAHMRIPPSACQILSNARFTTDARIQGGGNKNDRPQISCPIVDTSLLSQGSFRRFNLHYFDNNDGQSTQAQPCVTFFSVFGGKCEGLFQANQDSFRGTGTLAYPEFRLWEENPFDFAFISVKLPGRDCSGGVFFGKTCGVSFFNGAFVF